METTIDPTSGAAAAAPSAPEQRTLGRDDFLRLFIAKLENQDPLSPARDEEFVAQLATFSSLEQLISVNQNLESLAIGQATLLNAQTLDLIGKQALVESDRQLRVVDGVPDQLVYAVPRDAREVTLSLVDGDGTVVREFSLDTSPRGRVTIDWDALIGEEPLADGEYQIGVRALDIDGEPMSIALFRSLPIDGVTFADGFITLISGDREIPMDSILEFRAGRS